MTSDNFIMVNFTLHFYYRQKGQEMSTTSYQIYFIGLAELEYSFFVVIVSIIYWYIYCCYKAVAVVDISWADSVSLV